MNRRNGGASTVLVVDDDRSQCAKLRSWLEKADYRAEVFHDGAACVAALQTTVPEVICLDLHMPGMSGLETLERVKALHPLLPVVILTSETAVQTVVSAMRLGAYDYLTKPIDRTELTTTVKNAIDRYRMSIRLSQLEREVAGRGYPGIIGDSPPMKELFRQLDRIVASDITVLIQGESGTGKELIAHAIHDNSGRGSQPFVAINCTAIPETLQESELFGHEKGAFTGATARRKGRFEQADGGTLFLDEVAELSLQLQAKLLRALQERSFQRVGGNADVQSDFRLLAATHGSLEDLVRAGEFREDLYFRIAVFELEVAPLRDRSEDIPLIAQKVLTDVAQREGREAPRLAPASTEALTSYRWPGNVRELQNALLRAVVLAEDDLILPEHLPARVLGDMPELGRTPTKGESAAQLGAPPEESAKEEPEAHGGTESADPDSAGDDLFSLPLEAIERRAIAEALRRTDDNISQACARLGIGRATIYRKMKKYGLRKGSAG